MLTKKQINYQATAEKIKKLPQSVEASVATVFDESAKLDQYYQKLNIVKDGLQNPASIGLYLFVFCLCPALIFWDKSLMDNVISVVMISPDMDATTTYYLGWAVVIGLIVIDLCIGVGIFLVAKEAEIDYSKKQVLIWAKFIGFFFSMLIPLVKIGEQISVYEAGAFTVGSAVATGAIAFY